MNTRIFGNTGLTVSPIGLGLAALGRPGYINLGHASDLEQEYDREAMQERSHRVLDAAWDAGVRYFDAARSYGLAEVFLGSWLSERRPGPDAVTIGSKWGYTYTAGWQVQAEDHEIKEHSLPVLNRQVAESEANLGSYLKLYQIHSATLDSGVLENAGVLNRLAELQAGGLRIGLSLSGPRQADTLKRAMDVTFEDRPLFDAVQATWNLLEQSAGPALREAHRAGMGVIVKEALANGRLTPRNNVPDFQKKLNLLSRVAAEHETSVDALAIAVVLAQPWADVVLSGAANVEHLRSNVSAVEVQLTSDLLISLNSLVESPAEYWSTRSGLPWN